MKQRIENLSFIFILALFSLAGIALGCGGGGNSSVAIKKDSNGEVSGSVTTESSESNASMSISGIGLVGMISADFTPVTFTNRAQFLSEGDTDFTGFPMEDISGAHSSL